MSITGGGGADSGQAANRSWWGSLWNPPSAQDLGAQITDKMGSTERWTEELKRKGTDMLDAYPGYGELWTFGPGGVSVTLTGKIALAGLAVGVFLLMGRR